VGLSNVVAIAAGTFHSLALRSDGTLVAWGDNNQGLTNSPVGLSDLAVSVIGSVDLCAPGIYTLTYTSTNILGGLGTATRTVVVGDALSPIILSNSYNPANRQMTLIWTSVPGAVYSVVHSTNLAAAGGGFSPLTSGIASSGSTTTNTVTLPAGPAGFVRIRLLNLP